MPRDTLAVRNTEQFLDALHGAGLDRKDLAAAVKVSKQFVSLLARGLRRCNGDIAGRIARELNTTADALFTSVTLSEESNNKENEMPPVVELDDPYLLFPEVCELTRITEATMRKLRAKGGGPPFFRRGQILTIRKSDALKWFRETYENAPAK
ncbi:helix-turn-helix domain-containing protein [Nonomuraea rhizosphaerae]|uniref:helix-turn-helix domain-containing protein n=1 Tax=Nonomuraea rhizosphaerae TaxID=2665663 RepID=UPI001C5CED17|nr:helix-turn-helix domain-containing protein [Nonomuraea rhizosphaerae]